MPLDRLQKLFSYLCVGFALGAMGVSGALGPIGSVLLPALIIASWFWDKTRFNLERQRVVWNVVLIGFIGWTAWVVSTGSAPVLQPAVDLVLVLVIAKLYQRQTARDYSQIYALSFLMIAVSTVLDVGFGFAVFFLGFVLSAGVGFSLCHLQRSAEDEDSSTGILISRRTMGLLGGMSLLLVVMSIGFFLFLPRIGIGMGRGTNETATQMTGFSDSIDLGDHGAIGLDDTVVMRVATPSPVPAPYWRGLSFDYFDGRRWMVAPPLKRRKSAPIQNDEFVVAPWDGEVVEQVVELDPINSDVLFSLPHPVRVSFAEESVSIERWQNVSTDRRDALYHSYGPQQRVHYTVKSRPQNRRNIVETLDATPLEIRKFYLAIPSNMTRRAKRLAKEAAGDATSSMARAQAIETYLSESFDYTLELPARGDNPIDNFLFEDQRGHCEFFSTAMVLMLRENGIAARNVNGFQGGEWNEVGGYYIVRRLHAHSWVEAWIPGAGWVTFDPTPSAGMPTARAPSDVGFFGQLGDYMDALRRSWRQWVLNYDVNRQLDLFGDTGGSSSITGALEQIIDNLIGNWLGWLVLFALFVLHAWWIRRSKHPAWLTLLTVVVGICLVYALWRPTPAVLPVILALFIPFWTLWRVRIASDRVDDPRKDTPLARLRTDLVDVSVDHPALKDVERLPPLALAARLDALGHVWSEGASIVRRYAKLRFGAGPANDSDISQLVRDWRNLRPRIRQEASAARKQGVSPATVS